MNLKLLDKVFVLSRYAMYGMFLQCVCYTLVFSEVREDQNKGKETSGEPAVIEASNKIMQDITITGKITDENAQGLPGVSILVKGTTSGTISNIDGSYSLDVSEGAVLVVTYVGYQTKEIIVGNVSVIDVAMALDVKALQEVVITALGIEKDKKTLGYATSNVSSDEFTTNRTPKFMNALQGKVAGVNITQLGVGPQGSTKIRIRGNASLGKNNQPLIVVNGIPIDNSNFGVNNGGSDDAIGSTGPNNNMDTGDGLSSINPDDIESMSVLKGGPAAALYGYRARNGVIMITTKNRTKGEGVRVEYNLNYTNGSIIDRRDYQFEYGQGENGQRPTTPFPTSGVWSFGEKIEPGMTQILFDNLTVPYEAQENQLNEFYNNASNVTNTIAVSTGGENGGMNLSISDMTSKGVLPGNEYNRKTANFGFTQKTKKLTVSGNITYSYENIKNPPNIGEQDFSAVVMYTVANTMPMDVLRDNAFDEFGNEQAWSRFRNRTNPYFALSRFNNVVRDRLIGVVTAKYDFTDWLSLQGRIGQDYWSRDQDFNVPNGTQSKGAAPAGFVNGDYVTDIRRFRELNADFLLAFNKTFGNIGIYATFGGNHMYQRLDVNTEQGGNFYQRDLYTIGNASQVTPNYILQERMVNSLYGSAEISYKGFLYLNGTIRNDWFSTLSPDQRSILYPSVTGSWVWSQTFESMPDWMTFGKLRLGWSKVGSDDDISPYNQSLFYRVEPQNLNGYPIGQIDGGTIPNQSLRPLNTVETEIGLETMFFDNLVFEFSLYTRTAQNQILTREVSNASGYNNTRVNVAESSNKGLEFAIGISPFRSTNFEWRIDANATFNKSEVISLGTDVEGESITVGNSFFHGELRQVVGRPMAQLYGWGYLRDPDGNIIHDANSGRPLRSAEQIEFGTAIPTSWGGITNSFTYKGIMLSVLIDFKLGHKIISGTHVNAYRHGFDKATLPGRDQGFVIGEGVKNIGTDENPDYVPNDVQTPVQTYYETIRGFRGSEQSVFDAGSWQLRQITLGYDFTRLIPDNKYIKGVKLSLVANNVAILATDIPHIHPDQNGIMSDLQSGLEATGIPVTRDFGFNLNLQF